MSIEGHTNTRISGYLLGEVIGRGGMGVVYRATHVHLGRSVAIKLLAPELSGNDEFRRRFLRESRLAASLEHPNVIAVYDAGDADGTLYIAMRYIDGVDLARYLRDHGPLEPLEALSLLDQVAAALDAAHEHGLIHRDVKPANVMVASGRCYLTDFGLTKQASAAAGVSALTRTGSFLGTLNYTAPEQIEGRELTASADLYALGCVLQECLTGAPPFTKDSEVALLYAHLQEPPPPPSQVRPDLPPAIDAVMAKALAKLPGDRYATCGEFMAAARAALTQEPGPAVASQPPAPPTVTAQPPTVAAAPPTVAAEPPTAPAKPTEAALPPAMPAQPAEAPQPPAAPAQPAEAVTRPEASPTLAQEPGEPAPPGRRGSRRRLMLLAAGAAAVAVAIVGVVIASGGSSAKHTPQSPSGRSSGQTPTGHTTQSQPLSGAIPVGNAPDALAGAGKTRFLWVANAGDGTIMRIDEVTRTVSKKFSFANQSNPYAPMVYWPAAAGSGPAPSLWVGDFSAETVEQIDPGSGVVMSRIPVGGQPYAMTVAPNVKNGPPGNLWIASYNNDTIAFIKPGSTNATVISGLGSGPKRMAESGTTLFVANEDDGKITEVDALTGTLLGTIPVGGHPTAINYDSASGSLWVVDSQAGSVRRFNVASGTPTGGPIKVGSDPKRLTSGGHYMWIANSGDGSVTRINTVTGQPDPPIHVGGHPDAITASNKIVWVALWAQPTSQHNGPAGGVRLIDESKGTVLLP